MHSYGKIVTCWAYADLALTALPAFKLAWRYPSATLLETYGAVAMCYATVNYDITADAEKPNVYDFNGKLCALCFSLTLNAHMLIVHTAYDDMSSLQWKGYPFL